LLIGKSGVVGIDIGTNSIKIVELEEVGTTHKLKNIGEAPIAQGVITNKVIQNSNVVSNILSSLIDDIRIQADDAAVSISGNPVLLKRVSLPTMSSAELKKSIKWEFEQLSSNGIRDFNYDYQVIDSQNSNDRIDVLIVAVNKLIANQYLSIISAAGLNPVLIDLDVFSLATMYQENYPDSEGQIALVNIGASVTNILILQNGEVVFARDLLTGGDIYSHSIMTELDITYDQAEEVKHSQSAGFNSPVADHLADDFIKTISAEIKETMDYYSAAHSQEKVKRIMIGGGTAMLPGLKEKISEITQSYVGILNPFRNIDLSKDIFDPEYVEDISPKLCIAAGLALNKA
jgi:type IV pilus assembly protein PilM